MDCDIALGESLIIVPQTYTKPPGSPFRDDFSKHKTYFTFAPLPSPSLSALLEEFKTKCEAKSKSLDNILMKSAEDSSFLSESLSCMVKRYTSQDSSNRPGEMKKSSDEDADLIQLSLKILSFFGMSIVIKPASSTSSRKLYTTLKLLIPEVCLFPVEFLKKLQINHFVFLEEESDQQSPSTKATSFSLVTLDTQLKVVERLYQIIFIHILRQNPQKEKELNQESFSGILDYEKTFISLMKNSNNFHLKNQMEELKKWLSKQYPELSEEWVQNRILEKKKLARVSFCV